MVNHMVDHRVTERVFAALGDERRTTIVSLLAQRDRTVSELAASLPITLQGTRKHLGVLAQAGLVSQSKQGRTVTVHLEPQRLDEAEEWLERTRSLLDRSPGWSGRELHGEEMSHAPTETTVTQVVPAPPAQVFNAWTDAERLATWWWPHLPDTTYDVDAVIGGRYRFRSDAAGIGVHGAFIALEPPRRLEMSWVWEDGTEDGPDERVVVDVEPTDVGSRVTVTHAMVDPASAEGFRQGWTDCLDRLRAIPSAVSNR